jgi:excinuclease ABC subunit C
MNHTSLRKKIKDFPRTPGIYIFRDAKEDPLYIGKAIRLRDRLISHLRQPYEQGSILHEHMIQESARIDIQETHSEIEALILEAKLIKKLKPRYNILMRDDSEYFYVAFTGDNFPKPIITHQKQLSLVRGHGATDHKLQANMIGPFVSGRSLKGALRFLRRIFPYCTCKRLHINKRTCLNYHMNLDPGYCCEKNEKGKTKNAKLQLKVKNYQENIKSIKKILKGQKASVIRELQKRMKEEAKSKNFEQAAHLRNQLEGIDHVLAHKKAIEYEQRINQKKDYTILKDIYRIEGYDISNIQGKFAVGSMVVVQRNKAGMFMVKKSDYRRFRIKTVKGANDPAMMKEVIRRRLNHPEWPLPDLFLVDGGKTQRNAALQALKSSGKYVSYVWGLAKQEEELYTTHNKQRLDELAWEDARPLKLARDEAHRFAIGYYRKVHRKNLC